MKTRIDNLTNVALQRRALSLIADKPNREELVARLSGHTLQRYYLLQFIRELEMAV